MNRFRKIFYPLESLLYLVLFTLTILGAVRIGPFASKWTVSQTKIIYVACFCGASGCWFVPLFEKALKIKVSILADIMIAVDVILSVVCGEMFGFYRTIPNYDKFLHGFGTAQIAIAGYAISMYSLEHHGNMKNTKLMKFYSFLFGFFLALGCQMLWELYEFTVDSIAGTDMQKYVPDEFVNQRDPDTWMLTASDEEIAEYYRDISGYRFALMDTMGDVIADIVGSGCGLLFIRILFYFKPSLASKLIRPYHEEIETEVVIPLKQPSEEHSQSKRN